jgi:two-component system response regulator FixJ
VTPNPLIHIIDDDAAVRDSLGVLLGACGLESVSYASPLGFLEAAPNGRPGCVVTDVQMPEMSGLELLERLAQRAIALPVIVMTGRAERDMAAQAVRRGAASFLDKPFSPDELLTAIRGALAR